MKFSRQAYRSGLPFLTSWCLPHPGIRPASLASPAFAGRFFTTSATWEALLIICLFNQLICPSPTSTVTLPPRDLPLGPTAILKITFHCLTIIPGRIWSVLIRSSVHSWSHQSWPGSEKPISPCVKLHVDTLRRESYQGKFFNLTNALSTLILLILSHLDFCSNHRTDFIELNP